MSQEISVVEPSISIIIPVYNEAAGMKQLLSHLYEERSPQRYVHEIIIVDGGSTDGTIEAVEAFTASFSGLCIRCFSSAKGRARQMNFGAKKATGKVLYFLHADSFPPRAYDQLIARAVLKDKQAGCFRMKFDSGHWWLRLAGWFTQFSWRSCRGGDQSLFVTSALFHELHGYNEEFEIYEDIDFINTLYASTDFEVIQSWLTTSARRYESRGVWKLQYHFWSIYVRKWLGANAEELAAYYHRNIA